MITIKKGATALLRVDLTQFDFQGGYVVLTIKHKDRIKPIFEHRMDTAEVHIITLPDELTARMQVGDLYQYDIMWHINDERFAQCPPQPIRVVPTVGGYIDDRS